MSDSHSELSQLNAVISTLQAKINTLDVKVDDLEKKLLDQPDRIDGGTISATSIKCGNILLDGKTTIKEEK
ncbi:hypothetical protein [Pisciglobus halotolerans]|uniref:Uncharacterized protein n=1 Tax=Pisciglobus halotolerans TaxID=745365 RepID=A0A1I3C1U0_9LACT|nr:hypothetical protein [Pisciglobus halotolerans]SFH68527.1 hypothetical protein SAMN04489868_11228 [Pisciglobus halotolerans]